MGKVMALLPEGTWIDLFTGTVYNGDRKIELYRSLDSIPVLAKAGAIVTLDARTTGNAIDNPEILKVIVAAGANGSFRLDEEATDNVWCSTTFTYKWGDEAVLTITPEKTKKEGMPAERAYELVFAGTAQGMTALVYYVLVYAAANLGVFAVITIVALRSQKFTLEDYAGLYKTNPKIALLMTLSLFSLAGIPPFAGFFSKFFYLHGCFRCRFPLAGIHRIGKYSDFVVLLSIDCKSNVHHSFRQPDSYFPQRPLHKMGTGTLHIGYHRTGYCKYRISIHR